MSKTFSAFFEVLSRRGSAVGGGSAAAVAATLSAGLLEKILPDPAQQARLRRTRKQCFRLIDQDARAFEAVMHHLRQKRKTGLSVPLKQASEVQWRLLENAQALITDCSQLGIVINRSYRSDLACARHLAQAAAKSAEGFIRANAVWLDDDAYREQTRTRLAALRARQRRQRTEKA